MSARVRFLRDRSGGSAVEFSLLAAIFFVMLFGVFQLGLALHYGASVRWALETSARSLLISPTTTQAQLRSQMLGYLSDVPGANSVKVTLASDISNPSAKVFKATSSYAYPLSVPLLPTYNLTFNASVTVPAA
ncbi:TadE/TadG family type IV pilus assembly protein [Phenylobacterium soli]|uniref:Pilus assembly protein n=1 Tax=Phenylobacterium soli TaxID=2170551 RepID=A0A328ALG4_9CAUL|nr:TadE/TadG family type IV pilus assembly protein [Phenylobacterium soli]RAK55301.1 pilus assembly protein [Phenylobacterium soli]